MNDALYPRFAEAPLLKALTDSPAVLLHGPRQCGKTTLARMVGEARGYAYFTFGVADAALRLAAQPPSTSLPKYGRSISGTAMVPSARW